MKFGQFTSTMENLAIGGEGSVADQEPGIANAVPNDPETNEITNNDVPTDISEEDIVQVDEKSEEFNKELDENNRDSAKLQNASETLDELQNSANNMVVAEEVISPLGVKTIEQTLESILKRIGVDKPSIPSMESFKGTWTKKEASRLTMEAIDTTGGNIAQRILKTVKALISSIVNFLAGLFRNRKLMEMHVLKLIKKAQALDSDTYPRQSTVKGRFVPALLYKGDTGYTSTLMILSTATAASDYFENINRAIQQLRDSRDPSKEILQFESIIGRVVTSKIDGPNGPIEAYGAFVGGKSMFYEEHTNYSTTRFTTNTPDNSKLPTEAPALIKDEILQVLEFAKDAIINLRRVESTSSRLFDAVKDIMRSIEMQYNALRGKLGSDDHEAKAKARKSAMQTQAILSDLVGRLPNMAFSAISHAAGYASASINMMH